MSRVRVLRRRRLSESIWEVELERPSGFRFAAGQSITVFVSGQGRDYSIASAPGAETLLLLVRLVPGGAVSPALCGDAADAFEATGPHGVFTFKPSDRPAVLAATGVGIAPFLSMVRAGLPASGPGVTFLHGVRSHLELVGRGELEAAGRWVACLSRDEAAGGFHGRLTDWARENLSPGGCDFYLCGNRRMIRDMTLLVDERFPGSRVFTEIFF